MYVSYYQSPNDGFSDVDPNALSSKYSSYMFTNDVINDDPIASPSSRR